MIQVGTASEKLMAHGTKRVMVVLFFGSLALLGVMVWQVGLTDLIQSFEAIGFWIAPYFLLKVVPMFLHTAGWAACFPGHRLPLRLWRLVLVARAGQAINQVTPTASIGGEMVKVWLLQPAVPRQQAVAAVIIDKASATLSKMLYLSVGMLYLAQHLPLPGELQLSLSLTIGLITFGLMGFVGFQRYGALSKLVHAIRLLRIGQGRFLRFSEHLLALDTQLVAYYKRYPWRFVLSLLLHVVAYAFEMVKTYILLRLLLGVEAPTFAEAAMVAVTVSALDEMFFFVPGRLGTLEGARFLVLSTLGVPQVYALAFGLIARAEHVVWNALGFVAYAVCTRFPTGATVSQEAQGCALRSEGVRQG